MKPTKPTFIGMATCILVALLHFSCTQESLNQLTESQEDEFSIPMAGDIMEVDIEDTDQMLFSVLINTIEFVPSKIKTIIDNEKINILATDETLDRSVFLTFKMEENSELILGRTYQNMNNNTAGYLFNSENKGFVTSEMYKECGVIFITEINTDKNTISGRFEFDACNIADDVLNFKDGVFENIPWSL